MYLPGTPSAFSSKNLGTLYAREKVKIGRMYLVEQGIWFFLTCLTRTLLLCLSYWLSWAINYSLVCSPIVCYLKERMANGDVAFYCNRHHCVDWTWNKNSWLTWNRITKSICILKWNTCEAHVSNRKEYGNGQSVKTVGRQWRPEERQGKDCKGAQKIHLKVKVGVGKKVKVERGHKTVTRK